MWLRAAKQIGAKALLFPAIACQWQPGRNRYADFRASTPPFDFFGKGGQCQQVVILILRFVAQDRLAARPAHIVFPAIFQRVLQGVRLVIVGRDAGWEGAAPGFDGVLTVINSNDHAIILSFELLMRGNRFFLSSW